MKKLLMLLAFVVIGTSASAQGLDFGIKAGVNFANISDVDTSGDARTGFVAGIFAGAKFNDKVGIQGDLLYSQQGTKFNASEFELSYVNVPVVLKYYIVQGLHIQAGPQFGFNVDDNAKEVFAELAEAKGFDLSGVVGAGLDLPLGLRIEARYNFGLSDVIEGNSGIQDVAAIDDQGKNSVVTISVGYSFL